MKAATPELFSLTVASVTPSTENCTEPVGVPLPLDFLTVADMSIFCPTYSGLGVAVTVVVVSVLAGVTVSVAKPDSTPPDACMDLVEAALRKDGVSAPATPADAGLAKVVTDAKQKGIDLKIVVLDHDPPIDTPLRDISTVVGADYHDATVLSLSPNFVGSYSTQFPRVTLEAGEDIAKTGNPVVSAQHFLNELNSPEFPWTGLTIFLLIGVLAAAVATRFLQLRSRRSATSAISSSPAHRRTAACSSVPWASRT